MNKEVLNGIYSTLELCSDILVVEETSICRNKYVWKQICSNEDVLRIYLWIKVQVAYDGYPG